MPRGPSDPRDVAGSGRTARTCGADRARVATAARADQASGGLHLVPLPDALVEGASLRPHSQAGRAGCAATPSARAAYECARRRIGREVRRHCVAGGGCAAPLLARGRQRGAGHARKPRAAGFDASSTGEQSLPAADSFDRPPVRPEPQYGPERTRGGLAARGCGGHVGVLPRLRERRGAVRAGDAGAGAALALPPLQAQPAAAGAGGGLPPLQGHRSALAGRGGPLGAAQARGAAHAVRHRARLQALAHGAVETLGCGFLSRIIGARGVARRRVRGPRRLARGRAQKGRGDSGEAGCDQAARRSARHADTRHLPQPARLAQEDLACQPARQPGPRRLALRAQAGGAPLAPDTRDPRRPAAHADLRLRTPPQPEEDGDGAQPNAPRRADGALGQGCARQGDRRPVAKGLQGQRLPLSRARPYDVPVTSSLSNLGATRASNHK
mmetsp:Transcript_35885/g.89556  ORF Transcript_35885/g.89556 Transcript_35885/m.89556 type:complete len:442 (+) Transcript_35885:2491-3816(+)